MDKPDLNFNIFIRIRFRKILNLFFNQAKPKHNKQA